MTDQFNPFLHGDSYSMSTQPIGYKFTWAAALRSA
jgi:hypothetical protein